VTQPTIIRRPLSQIERWSIVTVVVLPFLALLYAIGMHSISHLDLAIFFSTYLILGLGVTMGLHRYFTHNSFKTHWIGKTALAIAALMAIEGQIREWVANHLIHHRHSDTENDLHSPNLSRQVWRGLWHAHVGWMLKGHVVNIEDWLPMRLRDDRTVIVLDRLFPFWVFLSLAIAPMIGWYWTRTWHGTWTAFVWGSLVRMFFVHHITWSINSICHMYGSRPFHTGELSTNNMWCGILGFGEGYHRTHHRFPSSAKHGLLKGHFDLTWFFIWLGWRIGLIDDPIVPSAKQIQDALDEQRAA
jgi:stearoyl-CoA desaturase (delta-9 desaturase)